MHEQKNRRFICLLAVVFLWITPAVAWKLAPEGTEIERKLAKRGASYWDELMVGLAFRGIHKVGDPIHEEITNRMLGCDGDAFFCGDPNVDPDNAYFIAGVRWNDDPPFQYLPGQGKFSGCTPGATVRLVVQARCWASTFQDAAKRAAAGELLNGKNASLLARSHFGDLQFLHAMGSKDGETAAQTRDKILMWAEFTWKIGVGEYTNDRVIAELPVSGLAEYFQYSKNWRVQDLFALGNPWIRKPQSMSEVAIGSLLHIIQDSFAEGHVERRAPTGTTTCSNMPSGVLAPGRIVEFHSYANQDADLHGNSDLRDAFSRQWTSDKPSSVDIGKYLLARFQAKDSWDAIKPYLECVFALDNSPNTSSPGVRYVRER